ncbi:hypothetical protein [Dactylosporangium sp. NPDC049140]|uniref:hypothetical protein n=1 Tax=Dactylosporangium sp. NPDC049140 TaxID=3155647 RepID=UPI0033D75D01
MRSTKLLQLLFWGGVGLAPLAALLLLVGSGFVLQFAAVLGLLAVVLIGLSIALRREGETVKGEVEEMVYEEIDTLRENVRADITHAARQTHGQLVERIGGLHETVDALRNQVEMLRGQLERAAAQPPPQAHPTGSAPAAPGVLRHTETVQVTTKTMVVDPTESRSGTVYGAGPRADIPQQRRPDRSERMPARPEPRGEEYGRRPERRDDYPPRDERRDEYPARDERRDDYSARDERPARDERRQERPHERRDAFAAAARDERRDDYGRRDDREEYGRREERGRDQVRDQAREQTSWTEQLLRERMARSASGEWEQTQSRGADLERRSGGGRRRAVEDDDDDNVTGMRTTDRWASVHSDERGGRELRMGERRSAVHADETGTHVRIEDRWASVRQEEYYSDGGGHRAGADDDRRGERRGGRRRAEPDDRDDETVDPRTEGRYDSGTESPRRSEARRERERNWASGEQARVEVGRRPDEHWAETSYEEARRDETGGTRWSEVRRSDRALGGPQAALPASPAEPASRWTGGAARDEDRWAGPRDEERVSRRARPEDDEEYGWNGGRDEQRGGRAARQIVDFEGNDDRWR